MIKRSIEYLIALSSWIYYIGFGFYQYLVSEISLLDTLAGLFVSVFAPFFLLETGIIALIAMIATLLIYLTNWRYKFWLIGILQWLYVKSVFLTITALASV
ncbi:hypothetical protein [Moraxella oblonga]|uniref:hypothetical protein n=1 Tax=Moraxella oblonga TaxID=200413 RepID=UPI000829A03B|nr:hypothetical protein [Moraxella oblonga]